MTCHAVLARESMLSRRNCEFRRPEYAETLLSTLRKHRQQVAIQTHVGCGFPTHTVFSPLPISYTSLVSYRSVFPPSSFSYILFCHISPFSYSSRRSCNLISPSPCLSYVLTFHISQFLSIVLGLHIMFLDILLFHK